MCFALILCCVKTSSNFGEFSFTFLKFAGLDMRHPVYTVVLKKRSEHSPMVSTGSIISKSLDTHGVNGSGRCLSIVSKNVKPVIPSIDSKTVTISTSVHISTAEKNSLQNAAATMHVQSQNGKVGVILPPSATLRTRYSHSRKLIPLPLKPFYCGMPNWSGQRNNITEVPDKKHIGSRVSLPEIPHTESTAAAEELLSNSLAVSNCASSSWEFCLRCNDLPDSNLALPADWSENRVCHGITPDNYIAKMCCAVTCVVV